MKRISTAVMALAVLAGFPAAHAADGNLADATNRKVLRVCSIPENLPYSNDKGEGFENKIAQIVADELKIPIEYTWYPGGYGLVRRTLAVKRCDLVLGAVQTDDATLNTNHYYHTTYVMFYKKGSDLEGVTSFFDPKLKGKRISNQGGPIGDQVAKAGHMPNAKSYLVNVDRRYLNPEQEIIDDVLKGEIDVGILWGPFAGWFLKPHLDKVTVVPITENVAGTGKVDYRITMGVRQGESNWKRQLNEIIKKRQGDIDKVLLEYGVPLLDEDLKPVTKPRT
ncbi:MAG: quinoprotein dehydrogenase-associated putative ABC transporter substrate-binding protein [Hyphomicrobium sp.]|nr:quinoprotein dehydrogenase-associated putative ABC transporter substrate-binding protein [Hyphomicrobium sp.]